MNPDWDRAALEQEICKWDINIDPVYLLRSIREMLDPGDDPFALPFGSRVTLSGQSQSRPELGRIMIMFGKG